MCRGKVKNEWTDRWIDEWLDRRMDIEDSGEDINSSYHITTYYQKVLVLFYYKMLYVLFNLGFKTNLGAKFVFYR